MTLQSLVRRILPAIALSFASIPARATVHRVVLDGTIDPIRAEYVGRAMDLAERESSRLILIRLDTPGGLVDAMEDILRRMLSSRVPVAIYVGPPGAKAASAGFFLLVSADVAAMAPGTRTGAAHPILSIGGFLPIQEPNRPPQEPQPDGKPGQEKAPPAPSGGGQADILMQKVTNDIQAFLRDITTRRGRNPEEAAKAVAESRSFSTTEALEAGLIDLIAGSEAELLRALEGREIRRLDGSVTTLALADQPVVDVPMTFRERVLSVLVNPNVAFLMAIVGALLIYVEVTHAGLILPGVIGGLLMLMAVAGFSFLPVSVTGLLLVLAALGLFVAEVVVQSFGLLGLLGVVALALGGIMLVDVPDPEFRVAPSIAISAALAFGLLVVFLGTLALKAMKKRVKTGSEGMVGEEGVVVTDPHPEGRVLIRGEYWRAVSSVPLAPGTRVRCVGMEGLTIRVEPLETASGSA